jgi:hypothetical protein
MTILVQENSKWNMFTEVHRHTQDTELFHTVSTSEHPQRDVNANIVEMVQFIFSND